MRFSMEFKDIKRKIEEKDTTNYLAFILGTEAAGGIVGWFIRDGVKVFQQLPKAPLTPPPIVFPIAWTVLYGLMGYGAARIYMENCDHSKQDTAPIILPNYLNMAPNSYGELLPKKIRRNQRRKALRLYFIQLAVNLLWSPIFFNIRAFGIAFLWIMLLWVLILFMYADFKKIDKKAAYAQIPYILWTTFAAYLTYATWMLNR